MNISSRAKLVKERQQWSAQHKTVVLAAGCFDILHVGHLRYLQAAKELGDILIVGINSDLAVAQLKGPGRPYTSELERWELLLGFTVVDRVIIYPETTTRDLLLDLKPDIYAKGTDYQAKDVPWAKDVLAYGGQVVITGDPKDHSSSQIYAQLTPTAEQEPS